MKVIDGEGVKVSGDKKVDEASPTSPSDASGIVINPPEDNEGDTPLTERRGFFRFVKDSLYKILDSLKEGITRMPDAFDASVEGVHGGLNSIKSFRQNLKSDPASTLMGLGKNIRGKADSSSQWVSDKAGGIIGKVLGAPLEIGRKSIGKVKSIAEKRKNNKIESKASQEREAEWNNIYKSFRKHMGLGDEEGDKDSKKNWWAKRKAKADKARGKSGSAVEKKGIVSSVMGKARSGASAVFGFGKDSIGKVKKNIGGKWANLKKEGGKGGVLSGIGKGIGKTMGGVVGAITKGVGAMLGPIGIIVELVQMLAGSSPMLKAVLQLFQLAFTLFFMPFGNFLGEQLLPLAIKLIDWVVRFNEWISDLNWSSIKEWFGSIPSRISGFFGGIFDKIKSKFPGAIKNALKTAIDCSLIGLIYKAISKFFGNGGSLADALKGLATNMINGIKNVLGSIPSKISGFFGFAGGGYIPPTPGGTLIRVAEGTRGEHIVPDGSQMYDEMNSGGTVINITFSGPVYGMNDFEDKVNSIISKTSNRGYYR